MTSWKVDDLKEPLTRTSEIQHVVAVLDPKTNRLKGYVSGTVKDPHSQAVIKVRYTDSVGTAMLYKKPHNKNAKRFEEEVLKELNLVGKGCLLKLWVSRDVCLANYPHIFPPFR